MIYLSRETDPYTNIAYERLLMDRLAPREQVLFLWQNAHTIVIGRNQDAHRECRVDEFEASGGRLARRFSGGGAVYHDTGNLNFTFISSREDYSVSRNMDILCKTVQSFGLPAELSGRNDLQIGDAKFSGNAFFNTKKAGCHHGTIMVDVDTSQLARYLQPDPRKLERKGVASVKSRVVNLSDLDSNITVESFQQALVEAFAKRYGMPAQVEVMYGPDGQGNQGLDGELEQLRSYLASPTWRLWKGSRTENSFTERFDYHFPWGGIDMQITLDQGRIEKAHIYSDALDAEFIERLEKALTLVEYRLSAVRQALQTLAQEQPSYTKMIDDCSESIAKDWKDA